MNIMNVMPPTASSNSEEAALGPARKTGKLPFWLPVVILAVGILAYANSLNGPFIYDDLTSIPDNEHIRQLWPLSLSLSAPPQSTAAGRPIVCLSLALNYAIGGLNVQGYHLLNVALHLASALLLLGIIRRTLLGPTFGGRFERAAPWLAAASATLWMLHPLQTEAVDYIIQRTELFMAFFCLLTLYCAIRGWASSHRSLWFMASFVACALGMASKEVMVSVPVLVLLYDRLFISPDWKTAWRQHWKLHMGLAVTWLILAWLMAGAPRSDTVGIDLGVKPLDYVATQAGVILYYLRLCFWPHPLVITYDDWPIVGKPQAIPQGLLILILLAATTWAFRRRSGLAFVGAWFFLILAPTSSFVPIISEVAAERRMYLPLAAVVMLVMLCAHRFLNIAFGRPAALSVRQKGLRAGLVVVTAAVLCLATSMRNHDYRSAETIWADAVAMRPNSPYAHNELGLALTENNRLEEAVSQFNDALRIAPTYALAHHNLGVVLARQGKFDEAIAEYLEALRLKPAFLKAQILLGIALTEQGRLDDAIAHFTEAVRIKPTNVHAQYNLASLLVRQRRFDEAIVHYSEAVRIDPTYPMARADLGLALARQGRLDEAIAQYSEALRTTPMDPEIHNHLASALAEREQYDEAIRHYQEVIRIGPESAEAHSGLGVALARINRPTEALSHFREALSLKPDWVPALNAAAWLMATSPDGSLRQEDEAIRYAEHAAELDESRQDAGILDTLAAAYASAGQYDKAVAAAERAQEIASQSGPDVLAAEIAARLQLYRLAKPYREPPAATAPAGE